MPAVATGRSSEGDESVKAEEGPLETTSIAAPARAPSTPPETRRESMLSSMTPRTPKLSLLAAEHGVNVLKAGGFRRGQRADRHADSHRDLGFSQAEQAAATQAFANWRQRMIKTPPDKDAACERLRYCLAQAGVRRSIAKPAASATRVHGLRSAECNHPQPRSRCRPATSHVQARPPIRAVASSTIAESPLVASRRAAAIPAAPAPTMTTSALVLMARTAGCRSEGL
jgi:hypothetical protein